MVIAIEGMDGSGKSSVGKRVAEMLDFIYLDKPLKKFFEIDDEHFEKVCNKIYDIDDERIKALFFGLGNILTIKNKINKNIILDRHILSTYFWNGYNQTEEVFNIINSINIQPSLTIILYSDIEHRLRHIKMRDDNDKDLKVNKKFEFGYDKMLKYAEKIRLNYIVINGDQCETHEDMVQLVYSTIKEYLDTEEDKKIEYCKKQNDKKLIYEIKTGGING